MRSSRLQKLLLPFLAIIMTGAMCMDDPSRRSILQLAESGQLEEAEISALEGGVQTLSTLGDVLVLTGRIQEADSVWNQAIVLNAPLSILAEVGRAELRYNYGMKDSAMVLARSIIARYERNGREWSSDEIVAAGRAYVLLSDLDANNVRSALAAYDHAWDIDKTLFEARVRAGNLLLDKYNAPDAKSSFEDVLGVDANNSRALLGIARVQEFEGNGQMSISLASSLKNNPALLPALTMLSRKHLEAEAYDSALAVAERALSVNPSDIEALALRAATAWITGDSVSFSSSITMAHSLNPSPSSFYATLAESAVRQRRYSEGVSWAEKAVSYDSSSVRALGILGTNKLRTGDMSGGRLVLDRAFQLDPFNLWHKNTLDLLDEMQGFEVIEKGRFRLVSSPEDAELMDLYMLPMLEQAYDSFSARYSWKPNRNVRFEVFRRQADFSVRSVGLTGLGALGVSFGDVLAMHSPIAREPGSFNWGATALHELAHTFTLGASNHRVPRWISEGLSVLEERKAGRNWGASASIPFLAAFKSGQLRSIEDLNDGFVRPRFPAEVQFSYYLASLVCEMIADSYDERAIPSLLKAFADGLDTEAAFDKALGLSTDTLQQRFNTYMQDRFGSVMLNIEGGSGPGDIRGPAMDLLREGLNHMQSEDLLKAKEAFEKAKVMIGESVLPNGPSWHLAKLAIQDADTLKAIDHLSLISLSDDSALEANMLLAELLAAIGDDIRLVDVLERIIWIYPYSEDVHIRLAEAASRVARYDIAVRERRAIIAIGSADPLEARYQLAKTLMDSGDFTAARREVLQILEIAPGFEKAQDILLELRSRSGGYN